MQNNCVLLANKILKLNYENDQFELDANRCPQDYEHRCSPSGMESLAAQFHSEVIRKLRDEPCQAIPALYNSVR